MFCRWSVLVLPAGIALLIAGDQAWRDKRVAELSEEDTRGQLDDSPWAKTVTPVRPKQTTADAGTGEWVAAAGCRHWDRDTGRRHGTPRRSGP